jgi:hypothetical protein
LPMLGKLGYPAKRHLGSQYVRGTLGGFLERYRSTYLGTAPRFALGQITPRVRVVRDGEISSVREHESRAWSSGAGHRDRLVTHDEALRLAPNRKLLLSKNAQPIRGLTPQEHGRDAFWLYRSSLALIRGRTVDRGDLLFVEA